ncbi:hypothetical protein PRZ48_000417 [Zasmidium cellare]|uniref:Uncharacterized protein n=1 Tax=Zasmidium cellare TaxID=395010 RepID=A0ABR0EZ97_ZASCE|nr:hypothetical protein PRZ48_000417 [Zasmidium cellare]
MPSQSTQSTDSADRQEPELNEEEINSYIISTPLKAPSKPKIHATPKSKKPTYVFKEGYLLTPASETSSKPDGNEMKKQVGCELKRFES